MYRNEESVYKNSCLNEKAINSASIELSQCINHAKIMFCILMSWANEFQMASKIFTST